MSDDAATPTDGQGGDTGGQSGTYTPPATQADLDRIIADRLTRERAKFADYDDIKAKAAEHDKATEAQKSEIQKATERAEAAERALAAKGAEALRLTVAAKHGITGDHLDLLSGADEAELEAKALKLAALITPPVDVKKGAIGPYVPPEGTGTVGDLGGAAQAFADFLAPQLGH